MSLERFDIRTIGTTKSFPPSILSSDQGTLHSLFAGDSPKEEILSRLISHRSQQNARTIFHS